MTGSPEPVQFVELSVTPKSPYPPNTYESNVQLYSRASIPLHPLPLDYGEFLILVYTYPMKAAAN